jgi:hypothetical protein
MEEEWEAVLETLCANPLHEKAMVRQLRGSSGIQKKFTRVCRHSVRDGKSNNGWAAEGNDCEEPNHGESE